MGNLWKGLYKDKMFQIVCSIVNTVATLVSIIVTLIGICIAIKDRHQK